MEATTKRIDEIGSGDVQMRCTVAHRDGLPCGRRGVVAVTTTRGSSATMAVYCDGHRYMASPDALRWVGVFELICAERQRRKEVRP
jgi:hypothetical protein